MTELVKDKPYYAKKFEAYMGQGFEELWTNSRGEEMAVKSWYPQDGTSHSQAVPKGVVVLCHGFGHHIVDDEQWDTVGVKLSEQGFAVHGLDHIGCGRSTGKRGYISNFDNLVEDTINYRRALTFKYEHEVTKAREAEAAAATTEAGETKEASPADADTGADADAAPAKTPVPDVMPFFLMGESMGGATAILTAMAKEPGLPWHGVVLSAPMCGISDELMPPPCAVRVLTCMEKCCSTAPLIVTEDHLPQCFHESDKYERVLASPYRYKGKLRLGTGLSLKNAAEQVHSLGPEFTTPMLMMQGTKDRVTDAKPAFEFFKAAPSKFKRFVHFEGAWHALFWEGDAGRTHYFHTILSFLNTVTDAIHAGSMPELAEDVTLSEAELAKPYVAPSSEESEDAEGKESEDATDGDKVDAAKVTDVNPAV